MAAAIVGCPGRSSTTSAAERGGFVHREDILRTVAERARAEGISPSELMRKAIRKYLRPTG
jgi:hypothetical protein